MEIGFPGNFKTVLKVFSTAMVLGNMFRIELAIAKHRFWSQTLEKLQCLSFPEFQTILDATLKKSDRLHPFVILDEHLAGDNMNNIPWCCSDCFAQEPPGRSPKAFLERQVGAIWGPQARGSLVVSAFKV